VEAQILQGREPAWTPLVRIVSLPNPGHAARYSHDGHMLAIGGLDFSQLFLSGTGERLAELESGRGEVRSISFSCDNRILSTASGSTVRLWDVASGSLITTLLADSADICSVDFHPSIGYLLAAGDKDGWVYVWNIRDGTHTDINMAGNLKALYWVRRCEQKRVLVRREGRPMEMWDVDSPQQVQVFSSFQSDDEIWAVASSHDGSLVASGSRNGALAVYSTHTGELVHSHKHSRDIHSVAFSPTAPILAFASYQVGLWFYGTDRIVTFTCHSSFVYSIVFSPNGEFIASTLVNGTLCVWKTEATNPASDNTHHSQCISSAHFSNDGQLIVSASFDQTVKVWDSLTGTLYTTLKGHTNQVWDAIILPDNVHVVSICDDTLIVWDWQRGESLFTDTTVMKRGHSRVRTLHSYTHTLSPLGFISTHDKLYNSEVCTVCCWAIDLSAPSNPRIILVARAVVNTSYSSILRITHRGSAKTSNLTLVLECNSGKQFSALWDSPTVLDNSLAELQFVEELEESPLKNTNQLLAGSELPVSQSDDKTWILDEHGQQILWVPLSHRGYEARWYGHRLVIGGDSGCLTLVDFSNVFLNKNVQF
jgi:WD40 repeat protein